MIRACFKERERERGDEFSKNDNDHGGEGRRE